MQVKLPIIGQIRIGKDANPEPVAPSAITIPQTNLKDKNKFFDVLGGMLDISLARLSSQRTISTRLLEANKDWVYRNNDVIAQEVSGIEFELYQVGLSKGEIVYTEVEEHPLLDLLDRFNSTTTKADGIYTTQSHKKMTGDAFWYLKRNGPQITDLYVLQPDKITLDLGDPNKGEPLVRTYEYKDLIDGKEVIVKYKPEDIIPFKKPNPSNQYRGMGAVEALAETIDADLLANTTQKNFFKNGAITNFVLTTDSKVTDEQLRRLKADMKANNSGSQNAFQMMVLSGGLKPANISYSNRDLQLIDLLAWYRDKIMVGFGNTPASLGIIEDVNQANAQDTLLAWKRGTIKPDMDSIVGTLNEYLVPLFGKNLILGYVNPVPEDRTDDLAEAVQLKQAGIIMINEARELLDYETIDGGDIFAPLGMVDVPGGDNLPTADGTEDTTQNDDIVDEQDAESNAQKRRIYRKTGYDIKKVGNIPSALQHMDIKHLLRQKKMFLLRQYNHDLKEAIKPTIKRMLTEGKSKEEIDTETEARISPYFTNEEIMDFYYKQIHVVEVLEKEFENAIEKFIDKIEAKALENFDNELSNKSLIKKWIKKDQFTLFDDSEFITQAQLDLKPILMNQVTLAGQAANRLLGKEDLYVPYGIADAVSSNVAKFTQSMLDTDRDTLSRLISDGITNGHSIPEIRNSITNKFEDINRVQAQRITRTEVMRASNMANLDAWKQSGVVEAKQWLTAGASDECAEFEGQVVALGDNYGVFGGEGDEFANGDPPLHPNCRCVIIPVVTMGADDPDNPFDPEAGFVSFGDDDVIGEDYIPVYHGDGANVNSVLSDRFGDAFYVARNEEQASQYGAVSPLNIPFGEKKILKLTTSKEVNDFEINALEYAREKYGVVGDYNKYIPEYVRSLGYKAVEEDATENFGIAVVDKKAINNIIRQLKEAGLDTNKAANKHTKSLEDQIDKRTKEFKELQAKQLKDAEYIKALEELIDGS